MSLRKGDVFSHPDYGQSHIVAQLNAESLCGRGVRGGVPSSSDSVSVCARCREGTDYTKASTLEAPVHVKARTTSAPGSAQGHLDRLLMEQKIPWLVREFNAEVIL